MNTNERLLRQVPLFESLPSNELNYLAETLETRQYEGGEVLFKEGDSGDFFYIVRGGQIEVVKSMGTEDERVIAVRKPGEFVGEMSLFHQDGLRTASIRVTEPTDLWRMTRDDFNALLNRQPMLAYEMVRVLSTRLKNAHNVAIEDLREKNRQIQQAYGELEQAHEELKAAQEQIIEKEKLERELQLAYDIQMSILPSKLPRMDGFDFEARILPARSVGGDFYDLFELDQDRIGIMVGDVTDKGVPAAIFMAQTHALLRAEADVVTKPIDVLRQTNSILLEMNAQGLFVTVLYGMLDKRTGEFAYARGGHELPILCTGEAEVTFVPKLPGQPLGILDKILIDEQVIEIPPNGSLILYTDGVADERNQEGIDFGIERLLNTIGLTAGMRAHDVCENILESVSSYLGGTPQDDDLTLVVLHKQD